MGLGRPSITQHFVRGPADQARAPVVPALSTLAGDWLLERGLRRGSKDAVDQAWLLAELQERCQWSLEELARRFEHSKSWVRGRLALLQALPVSIQEQIRAGVISAHAAMKYLVPLARVNAVAAQALAQCPLYYS
jgi:hypothetical protein